MSDLPCICDEYSAVSRVYPGIDGKKHNMRCYRTIGNKAFELDSMPEDDEPIGVGKINTDWAYEMQITEVDPKLFELLAPKPPVDPDHIMEWGNHKARVNNFQWDHSGDKPTLHGDIVQWLCGAHDPLTGESQHE